MNTAPFLRAPPFPQASVTLAEHATARTDLPANALELLRQARVGGEFWEESCWSAIEAAGTLRAHGDDERLAIAAILRIPATVLAPGRYGDVGDDAEALQQRLLLHLKTLRFIDPFTGKCTGFEETVRLLEQWRSEIEANRKIAVACGMAWWKRQEIRRFLHVPGRELPIVSSTSRALRLSRNIHDSSIAVWPSRVSPQLLAAARAQNNGIVRVEDGFVRSVGLGSNLVPPSSVVVDARGIHFDPSGPSDLEHILKSTVFTPSLTKRAQALRKMIISAGISKYAAGTGADVPAKDPSRRVVLVPAQVEDDMSVLAGGGGLTSNLELLRRTRAIEPDAEIWFRPHPDVEAGHRKGAVPDDVVLQHADKIVRGGGMAPLLDAVDAVHVLTSLTGFEALMRGRQVTCHGTPFYAGWGLTLDLGQIPERRKRLLSLDELVAGVLILYPRYLDPVTGLPCPPEVLVARIASQQAGNRLGWVTPLRRWQGLFMSAFR